MSWDGRGLPPGAIRRLEAQKSFKVKSSFLTAKQSYGTRLAGFEPLSEVMGACVISMTAFNLGFCGVSNFGYGGQLGFSQVNSPVISNVQMPGNFAGTHIEAWDYAMNEAVRRMALEAENIGASAITDISIESNWISNSEVEFISYANALSVPKGFPKFSTHLTSYDVFKLIEAGYRPVEFIVDVAGAIVHDDYFTRGSMSVLSPNQEIVKLSELVHVARNAARSKLAMRAKSQKANGVIIASQNLEFRKQEAGENHVDHLASVTTFGTSIAVFEHKAKAVSLTMLKIG